MWHIKEFQNGLEEGCLTEFMTGLHLCRHRSGSWNAVFLVQFGEQTYIRQGKAKCLAWHFLQTRLQGASCLTLCAMQSPQPWMRCLWNTLGRNPLVLINIKRKATTVDYWTRLIGWRSRMNWINIGTHWRRANPDNLFNIVSGQVAGLNVNIHHALSLGEIMVVVLKASLPAGFLTLLSLRL